MISKVQVEAIEFSLKFVLWAKETHPRIINDLLKAYKGRKVEEE